MVYGKWLQPTNFSSGTAPGYTIRIHTKMTTLIIIQLYFTWNIYVHSLELAAKSRELILLVIIKLKLKNTYFIRTFATLFFIRASRF